METLSDKFNQSLKTGTPAEKRLARYYLEHPGDISFEMAANVADRLDLSPMTVGRYLRALDIDSYRLPPQPPRIPLQVQMTDTTLTLQGFSEPSTDFHGLRDQMDALNQVQALSGERLWLDALEALIRPAEIFCTSLGGMLPFSQLLAARLHEVRDGVRHLGLPDGSYADLLADARRGDCQLVIVDEYRSTATLRRLGRFARGQGCRVLAITHAPDAWVFDEADLVLRGPVQAQRGGLEPVALMALIELAAKGVAGARGPFAIERAARFAELQRALHG